ncbi:hypothetical protein HKX48_006303 [Thoreauomyces humboldtii]|nr:hypothetical protein HKX48_006303 [Thoreauomyces humboldtii]
MFGNVNLQLRFLLILGAARLACATIEVNYLTFAANDCSGTATSAVPQTCMPYGSNYVSYTCNYLNALSFVETYYFDPGCNVVNTGLTSGSGSIGYCNSGHEFICGLYGPLVVPTTSTSTTSTSSSTTEPTATDATTVTVTETDTATMTMTETVEPVLPTSTKGCTFDDVTGTATCSGAATLAPRGLGHLILASGVVTAVLAAAL